MSKKSPKPNDQMRPALVIGFWPAPNSFRCTAFTLLELLIAIAIFSVVLTAINGVFYGAMRLQSKGARTIEESLPVQQTVTLLKRDLQGIVTPGGPFGGVLQSGISSATANGPIPQGATTFYTCTAVLDDTSPWAEVQKVAYYLKPPEDPRAIGKDLVRAVNRNLLPTTQELFLEQWLMSGLERLQLAFYDGTTWRDSWDSTTQDPVTGQTNNLPRAIKVQLELAVPRGEPRKEPIQLIVPVAVQVRANSTQNAGGQQ